MIIYIKTMTNKLIIPVVYIKYTLPEHYTRLVLFRGRTGRPITQRLGCWCLLLCRSACPKYQTVQLKQRKFQTYSIYCSKLPFQMSVTCLFIHSCICDFEKN